MPQLGKRRQIKRAINQTRVIGVNNAHKGVREQGLAFTRNAKTGGGNNHVSAQQINLANAQLGRHRIEAEVHTRCCRLNEIDQRRGDLGQGVVACLDIKGAGAGSRVKGWQNLKGSLNLLHGLGHNGAKFKRSRCWTRKGSV